MLPRYPYTWRCSGCRRILLKSALPLDVLATLGAVQIKCHCNVTNVLG